MFIEKIEIANIQPKDLKKGHKILNVGIVVSSEEWANVFVVKIRSGHLNNVQDEIQIPKYHSIKIDCVDGNPCIF
jgi:hypothetical protein